MVSPECELGVTVMSDIHYQVIPISSDSTGSSNYKSDWERLEQILGQSFVLEDGERKKRRFKARNLLRNKVPRLADEKIIPYLDRLESIAVDEDPELGLRPEDSVRLACILFARPTAKLVKDDIIPNFNYWHHRSGLHVDFICVGYNNDESFSSQGFNKILKNFEERTSWKYSGETDLLLVNCHFDKTSHNAQLDFSNVVSVNLEDAIRDKAIKSVPAFFEEIISYASRCTGTDPTWGFSDSKAVGSTKSALVELILKLLPEAVKNEIGRVKYFAVRDVSTCSVEI